MSGRLKIRSKVRQVCKNKLEIWVVSKFSIWRGKMTEMLFSFWDFSKTSIINYSQNIFFKFIFIHIETFILLHGTCKMAT